MEFPNSPKTDGRTVLGILGVIVQRYLKEESEIPSSELHTSFTDNNQETNMLEFFCIVAEGRPAYAMILLLSPNHHGNIHRGISSG